MFSGVAPPMATVPVAVAPMRSGPVILPPPAGGTGDTLPDVLTAAVAPRTVARPANTAKAQRRRRSREAPIPSLQVVVWDVCEAEYNGTTKRAARSQMQTVAKGAARLRCPLVRNCCSPSPPLAPAPGRNLEHQREHAKVRRLGQ